MHHELHTEIDIDATPEVVWQVLTELDRYPEWNPFITSSVGEPEVGEKLVNRMEPPGGMAITLKPNVTVIEDNLSVGHLGYSLAQTQVHTMVLNLFSDKFLGLARCSSRYFFAGVDQRQLEGSGVQQPFESRA